MIKTVVRQGAPATRSRPAMLLPRTSSTIRRSGKTRSAPYSTRVSLALASSRAPVVASQQMSRFPTPRDKSRVFRRCSNKVLTLTAPAAQHRSFIYRTAQDVQDMGRVKKATTGTWESRRYVLRKDGFNHSFHHTILYAGKQTLIQYKNHVEIVFITHGKGEVEVVTGDQKEGEGKVYPLERGVMYILDKGDKHYLRAHAGEDMHVCCTFDPPIDGAEDHNADGVYPVIGADGVPRY